MGLRVRLTLAVSLLVTAASAQQFTLQEIGVVRMLNQFRRDPAAWIRNLGWERSLYRGNLLVPPGHAAIQTREGVRAVDEAIAVLRQTRGPIGIPLELSHGLSQSAAAHVRDTGRRGMVGHESSNGGDFAGRIVHFGNWTGSVGEAITYGDADPTGVISQMLIDDGVPDRGHRGTLLDPRWRYIGVSCGAHAVYRGMCVLDFAVGFEERTARR
ncbi:MAG TPA: CAP domain-containing protein [Bryobacteraceae bacterium]|nr:CAP domain-containing protein [Bryobacteraceae bacterium]